MPAMKRAGSAPAPHNILNPVRELGGEAAERAANITFAQSLQRTISKLTHALTRDAKHRTDLFERVLTTAFQTKIQPQYLRVARRQRSERLLDLVVEESIHRFLFRIGHLVGNEPLDERTITFRIHRRVEPNVTRVQRRQRLHDISRKTRELR